MKKLIACEVHDYFEAVCIHRFILEVTSVNGQVQGGVALDIITRDKQEYLVLKQAKVKLELNLTEISSVKVLTKNNLFSSFKVES